MDKLYNNDLHSLKQQMGSLCQKVELLQDLVLNLQQNKSQPEQIIPTPEPEKADPPHASIPETRSFWKEDLVGSDFYPEAYGVTMNLQTSTSTSTEQHQDVLSDDEILSPQPPSTPEFDIPPQIQIRRLTTQLTSAYQRIAALEDQLMVQRQRTQMHPVY